MTIVPNIKFFSEIVDKYEVIILDQWGVMHDGQVGYPYAIDCVNKLIKLEKKLIIISNSSQRKKATSEKLLKFGFDKKHFIEVMTSGEMVWRSLFIKSHEFIKNLGTNCYYLFDKSKEEGSSFIDGLNYNFVNNVEDADFILGCTLSRSLTTLDYVPLLFKAIKKNIPFVCANPDFETIDSSFNDLIICMGTIAELYKDFGGNVLILGKPSIDIYHEATKQVKHTNKSKFLAVGDSIFHDIKGANIFGIDSLLITSGIHKLNFNTTDPKWDSKTNDLIKNNITPTYLSSKFQF